MEITEIMKLISSYGFPIVACIALFLFNSRTINELKAAIDNNTQVMLRLVEKMKKEEIGRASCRERV